MVTTNYSVINGVHEELISTVEEVTWLSGFVYKNAWRTNETVHDVMVDLVRDSPEINLVNQGSYYMQPEFDIIYRQLANEDKELDKALIISGVGAILDVVRSHMSNCPYWEKIQIVDVDYKYYSPGMATLMTSEAKIRVKAKKEWSG